MANNEERALILLEKYDIRPSYQRIQILKFLLEDDEHCSADMIFTNLLNCTPAISRATVYNALNLFVQKGLVKTLNADKFETRYDIITHDHGHFICNKCGTIFNFNYDCKDCYKQLDGFIIECKEVIVKGLCNRCNKQI